MMRFFCRNLVRGWLSRKSKPRTLGSLSIMIGATRSLRDQINCASRILKWMISASKASRFKIGTTLLLTLGNTATRSPINAKLAPLWATPHPNLRSVYWGENKTATRLRTAGGEKCTKYNRSGARSENNMHHNHSKNTTRYIKKKTVREADGYLHQIYARLSARLFFCAHVKVVTPSSLSPEKNPFHCKCHGLQAARACVARMHLVTHAEPCRRRFKSFYGMYERNLHLWFSRSLSPLSLTQTHTY